MSIKSDRCFRVPKADVLGKVVDYWIYNCAQDACVILIDAHGHRIGCDLNEKVFRRIEDRLAFNPIVRARGHGTGRRDAHGHLDLLDFTVDSMEEAPRGDLLDGLSPWD